MYVFGFVAPSALADDKAVQLFVRRIIPLFHEKWPACHGNEVAKIKGGLDMRTLASTLKSGPSGTGNWLKPFCVGERGEW